MRLIDADALIERMYHDAFETDSDMQKWDSGCWIRYKMFEKALEDAPTIKSEWIPCNKRMPEEHDSAILKTLGINTASDKVYVTVECGDGERITAIARTYDGEWHWDFKHGFYNCKVVAWMPFPEPYKEGSI